MLDFTFNDVGSGVTQVSLNGSPVGFIVGQKIRGTSHYRQLIYDADKKQRGKVRGMKRARKTCRALFGAIHYGITLPKKELRWASAKQLLAKVDQYEQEHTTGQ